jgi:hypothetical protein
MVTGIERWKEYFNDYKDKYVLIAMLPWSVTLEAHKFSIIAPQGMGQGIMEVLIDGKHVGEVSFDERQEIKHQSVVFTSNKLSKGKHDIQLKNKTGMVAIDAIIIQ